MRRSDYIFLSVIGAVIFSLFVFLFYDFERTYSGRNQKTVDVTETYLIPEGLEGCRVFRMTPSGFGQTLYIISKEDDPKVVGWPGYKGKMTFVIEEKP